MNRLIITADIHGWYPCWQDLTMLLEPGDGLVVAGDLFDTVCGDRGKEDFRPEQIRTEWKELCVPKYYVYGNCDPEVFFPEQRFELSLNLFGRRILLRHGHMTHSGSGDGVDIVIQGHTHRSRLEYDGDRIRVNPGSPSKPRGEEASYAVMTGKGISLIHLKDHRTFRTFDFEDAFSSNVTPP